MDHNATPLARIGLIADTHVPDRSSAVLPAVIDFFADANVRLILHAGDVASHGVLKTLQAVAPVMAVRGNRDFLMRPLLPSRVELQVEGVRVAMAHGHGGFIRYLLDKWLYLTHGYEYGRYQRLLARQFPQADVVIFGHTHRADVRRLDGRLYINPGAAFPCLVNGYAVQVGLLNIYADGIAEGELITLATEASQGLLTSKIGGRAG